ncbi:ABC transporter ATP-binding protein [Williamsia sterculiae]|uniref:Putative ABC transport system ATP-binding protein n=1 Tax=Williamsia sterculiae TaxID=1344003 RepID=A0A1N7CFL5_9NOCA|nr:ABC transporter ATP-binding protein [Williamsia sterculiae]SIR62267.1 putative ABC transport system ATP-binding protein [Williamsia sterculiae]
MSTTGRQIIRRTLVRNRLSVTAGTALICLHQVCETAIPLVLGILIDRGVAGKSAVALLVSVVALGGLFVVLTVAFQAGMRLLNVALQQEGHTLRMEVAGRALAPAGLKTDLSGGELLTISSSDAEYASWFLDLFPRMAAAATAVIATAVALLVINLSLGLIVLISVPVFLALLRAATPLITRRAVAQQSRVAKATSMAGDLIAGLRSIKGIGAEAAASRRYAQASASALDATLSTVTSTSLQRGVTTAISALIAATIAICAGWYALTGRVTTGDLIAVAGLAQFLIEPLTLLSATPATVAKARGSAERIAQVLSAPASMPDRGGLIPDGGDVRLHDTGHRSLRSIDLDIPAGSLVAVFAHDRADGDALAAVLSGQLPADDQTGRVSLGGVRLTEIDRDAIRTHLIAEPHVTDLFAGTLAANVAAGADCDPERISRALAAAAAEELVADHAHGLDQQLHDRGRNLSGGQRQRLALARALYTRAPVLVLHDPTTAVDAVTEQAIASGLVTERHVDHTTVVITSSPTLLAVADTVVVLRHGRVEQVGTHADLLTDSRDYAEAVLR